MTLLESYLNIQSKSDSHRHTGCFGDNLRKKTFY
uniref:Uncharacterized protein n=1 Tax=Anguilla anguilla TaxID=7936 RepID=A0A0E9XD84_ANGAN